MKHMLIKLKDSFKLEKDAQGKPQKGLLIGRRLIIKGKFQKVQFNQKELELATGKIIDKKLLLKTQLAEQQKKLAAK